VTPLLIFWNSFVKSLRLWEEKLHGKSKSFIHEIKKVEKKPLSMENENFSRKTTTTTE